MTAGGEALAQWLAARVEPGGPAVEGASGVLRHGELAGLVGTVVDGLHRRGVVERDRVLLVLPNGVEHLVALLAVTALGAVAVPLDPGAGHARIARAIEGVGPALVMASDADTVPGSPDLLILRVHGDGPAAELGGERLAIPGVPALPPSPNPGSAALIRYSSGSTGDPKGVLLSHHQMSWSATTLARLYRLGADHRELVIAPMAHSGAWQRVAATLVAGGCVVFDDAPLSLPGLLDALSEQHITGWFSPPPLVRLLLKLPPARAERALAGCRGIEIGSGPVSADELATLMERCPDADVFQHYGLTECSRAFVLDTRRHPDKLHTVGLPAPDVEVEIRDEAGHRLAAGETGEIHLRGPQMASGYWRDAGAQRIDPRQDWLATGDLGRLDDDGFLEVRGRRDDRICSGGHSFFPAEVESALGPVEGVADYLVAGMPDEGGVLGEVPWAFVVPREPGRWNAQTLLARARRRLPSYMVPRRVVAVSELPLTASGKPDRRRLRMQQS